MVNRIPKPASKGYIYYKNLGLIGNTEEGSNYWFAIKQSAQSYFDKVEGTRTRKNFGSIVRYLRQMAATERASEIRLLVEYLGMDAVEAEKLLGKDLVAIMTENFSLRSEAEMIHKMVNNDLASGSDQKYYVPKLIHSYLLSTLYDKLDSMTDIAITKLIEGDLDLGSDWQKFLEEVFDETMKRLFLAVQQDEKFYSQESRDTWNAILNFYMKAEDAKKRIGKTLYEGFGFKEIRNLILGDWREAIAGKAMSQGEVADYYRANIRSKGKEKINSKVSNIVAGFLQEELQPIIKELTRSYGKVNTKYKMQTSVMPNRESTDVVVVLSKLSAKVELEMLQATTQDKQAAANKYNAFMDEMRKHQDAHILYESTKLYGLGKAEVNEKKKTRGFTGFSGGGVNFKGAINMLNSIGYPHAEAFLNKVAQTAEGAIYGSEASVIRKNASTTLAQYIAFFLFDDWDQIKKPTEGGPNVIHYFNLSNYIIPLSYLLEKFADALDAVDRGMQDGGNPFSYVNVRFDIPKIMFDEYGEGKYETTIAASNERWEKQMRAAKQFTIYIDFLRNFRELISGDLQKIFEH